MVTFEIIFLLSLDPFVVLFSLLQMFIVGATRGIPCTCIYIYNIHKLFTSQEKPKYLVLNVGEGDLYEQHMASAEIKPVEK